MLLFERAMCSLGKQHLKITIIIIINYIFHILEKYCFIICKIFTAILHYFLHCGAILFYFKFKIIVQNCIIVKIVVKYYIIDYDIKLLK